MKTEFDFEGIIQGINQLNDAISNLNAVIRGENHRSSEDVAKDSKKEVCRRQAGFFRRRKRIKKTCGEYAGYMCGFFTSNDGTRNVKNKYYYRAGDNKIMVPRMTVYNLINELNRTNHIGTHLYFKSGVTTALIALPDAVAMLVKAIDDCVSLGAEKSFGGDIRNRRGQIEEMYLTRNVCEDYLVRLLEMRTRRIQIVEKKHQFARG